jgi:2-polyprenyl-6-methoxyphenol hydroxylase-like FAD-dependent oxidoreductase
MRIRICGGGPAGLFLAILIKRRWPDWDVAVFEQNPATATYGFGVVFQDKALARIEAADGEVFAGIHGAMEAWDDLTIYQNGRAVRIDGQGYTAIGRLRLLEILQGFARDSGVELIFDTGIDHPDALEPADLIVGADGVSSRVRAAHEDAFGTHVRHLTNRFAWFGTSKPFDTLSLTFRGEPGDAFVAHHYRYAPDRSTFLVEVDAATFDHRGFAEMDEEASARVCEQVFAEDLDGHRLICNRSIWRRFPVVTNQRMYVGNRVIIGDALRTAHFSIGSGTRLAMEDAIALFHALDADAPDVPASLARFEAERRPPMDKLLTAAANSYEWYEDFGMRLHLDAFDLAYDYMTRSGRVSDDKLRQVAPRFMAEFEAYRASQ